VELLCFVLTTSVKLSASIMGLVQEAGALVAALSPLQLAAAIAALVVRRSNSSSTLGRSCLP